jgi:signal transduction histidine kinase
VTPATPGAPAVLKPPGQSLSLRLALLLSVAVVGVLLVTGLVVNRLVSRSLEEELSAGQRERLAVVAEAIGQIDLGSLHARRGLQFALDRVAAQVSGRLQVRDPAGALIVDAGGLPPGTSGQEISQPIPGGGSLVLELPSPGRGVLQVFNLTLLVAGALAVLALIGAATLLSDRLTRPLRGVAAAAGRLGAGDMSARATGGPDRESAELAAAFNAMADRLERSEALRRRAASDMAHDLATPATVLESQLQAMADGVVPADAEQLERARAAAGAMSGMIVQLRELVDAEAATLQREPTRVPLGELLDRARQSVEPLFRERRVNLDGTPPAGDVAVEVDVGQISRALRNVLINAAQHATEGGRVVVQGSQEAGAVAVRVSDDGPGIAAEDLPHIFERFYRADRARRAGWPLAGSGIGLTIARELLTANGGSIEVERTGQQGTTFRLRLPAARADTASGPEEAAT